MGKSGSIIDLAKEKANDASDDAKGKGKEEESGDPTEGAEPSGEQWKPPGANAS
jgi:hypothetical protein